MTDDETSTRKVSDRRMTAAVNARTNLIAEIRRSAGAKTATRALPFICAQLGIPIDLGVSETLAQSELSLSQAEEGRATGNSPLAAGSG